MLKLILSFLVFLFAVSLLFFTLTPSVLALDQDDSEKSYSTILPDPLGQHGDFAAVVSGIIRTALGLTGVLAVIAFIWGGIQWMTSSGDQAKVDKGKKMMVWAIYGLIVIFGSYAILNLVFQALGAS